MSLGTRLRGRCADALKETRCELPANHGGNHKAAERYWRIEEPFVPTWRRNLTGRDNTRAVLEGGPL